jgi:sec-independent protein translocase protein TatA
MASRYNDQLVDRRLPFHESTSHMFGSSEAVIVIVLIMLLFGGSQIPKLARNLGIAQKELKDAMSGEEPKKELAKEPVKDQDTADT